MSEKLFYDFRPMATAITSLEQKVADLTRRLDEQPTLANPLAQATADIDDLKAIVQQHKDWLDRLEAALGNLVVRGGTGRSFGHAHSIELPVVKK